MCLYTHICIYIYTYIFNLCVKKNEMSPTETCDCTLQIHLHFQYIQQIYLVALIPEVPVCKVKGADNKTDPQ